MRKIVKLFIMSFFSILVVITLSSCGDSKWDFSKSDAAKFYELDAALSETDSGLELSLTSEDEIFGSSIKKSNIVLFDYSALDESSLSGYLEYSDIKDQRVSINSVDVDSAKEAVLSFEGEASDTYGVLIHKKATSLDNHAFAFAKILDKSSDNAIITEYEEQMIKSRGSWSDAKAAIDCASYISQIVLGGLTDNPVSFAGGIFGLFTTIGGKAMGSGATIEDVMKKLVVIDGKLDAISAQIDANQKQILDEFVRTDAMIDEVKVIEYNQNIQSYQTDYVKPITDYLLVYKDSCEQAFRKYVNEESQSFTMYYGERDDDSNALLYVTEDDVTAATSYEITITDFSNSLKYLSSHKDIVGNDFYEALTADLVNAISSNTLPSGKSEDELSQEMYQTIANNISYDVLATEDDTLHREVLQLLSNFTSFAGAISGASFETVLSSYINRLQCIYNFSSEIKEPVRNLLASIKLTLDSYMCIAQTACLAQKINYSEQIYNAYIAACDVISSTYDAVMAVDDSYSFTVGAKISGDLYNAKASVWYTNPGNSCDFHAIFGLYKIESFDGSEIHSEGVDVNDIAFVDYRNNKGILTRYGLLKSSGYTEEKTYREYLKSVNILSQDMFDILNRLFEGGRTVDKVGKIICSYNIRDLYDSDSNLTLECICYGNPDGYFFHTGYHYNYRYSDSDVSSEYWSGKIAYGDLIDANTGALDSSNLISAYARYAESHRYWFDDEHWAFSDDYFGQFCFILNVVTE